MREPAAPANTNISIW